MNLEALKRAHDLKKSGADPAKASFARVDRALSQTLVENIRLGEQAKLGEKIDALKELFPKPKKPRRVKRDAPLRESQNEAYRAIQREIDNAKKKGVRLFDTLAAKRIMGREAYKPALEGMSDESVLRKFRAWKRSPKRKRTD